LTFCRELEALYQKRIARKYQRIKSATATMTTTSATATTMNTVVQLMFAHPSADPWRSERDGKARSSLCVEVEHERLDQNDHAFDPPLAVGDVLDGHTHFANDPFSYPPPPQEPEALGIEAVAVDI
jgi:hypothetical protein